jgi:hypothetical protein
MQPIDLEWDRFRRAAQNAGAVFEPLSADQARELEAAWRLPSQLSSLWAGGYPQKPVNVAGYPILATVEDLLSWRREDSMWPRDWFPLVANLHHRIFFLRPEVGDGVWSLWNDTDFDDTGYQPGQKPTYATLAAFLHAITLNLSLIDRDAYEWREHGRLSSWLTGKRRTGTLRTSVVREIEAQFGDPAKGPPILPWVRADVSETDESLFARSGAR